MARLHEYHGEGITVRYDPRRCFHAAECVRGSPRVFNPKRRPWVDPDAAEVDAVVAVVENCPSGALSYERTDGGSAEAPAPHASIRVGIDGPLMVRGTIRLQTPDDEPVAEGERLALCRCGASKNKPFCDGSHYDAGFAPDGD